MRRCWPKRGFTLLELLVVLGIIALLTAILLPSLSAAKSQANRTRCLANLRQIGVGIALYIHDFKELPPVEPLTQYAPRRLLPPVFYSERRTGLLALRPSQGFERRTLACPDGWASMGFSGYYDGKGISQNGSAYMDYAYWARRYEPGDGDDVRFASFTYRRKDKGTKILVTDIVADQSPKNVMILRAAGLQFGNHASNHSGPLKKIQLTDGHGGKLAAYNIIRSSGASALFSDYHAQWMWAAKLTQQAGGLCYPPPDQWR